jgi:hypothetical protein
MDNAIIWLIRLLAAHLLTDFVLQPRKWVDARRQLHLKAKEFWWHISLTAAVAAWFTGFDTWWVPMAIFISHGFIDWWKSYRKESVLYFSIDQILHLLAIFLIWQLRFIDFVMPLKWMKFYHFIPQFWIIALGVVFLTNPVGIMIGMVTKPFRNKIENHGSESLENAGTWIGMLERLIIFFLVLIGKYEVIGLLIAAKSIIRLKDGDQKMGEYVLIGTLISVSVAIVTGYIVSKLL